MAENTRHEILDEAFSNGSSLAKVNGVINRMSKEDIRIQLRLLGLHDRGVKEVLMRRLKNYYKKQKIAKPKTRSDAFQGQDYFVVIDFEGTCEKKNAHGYIHEIIEFPAVLVNARTLELEDEFHSYCKPLKKPILSEFCQHLTGITQLRWEFSRYNGINAPNWDIPFQPMVTKSPISLIQESVNAAKAFSDVLTEFNEWLIEHRLGTDKTFVIATDGPWDMGKFLPEQCNLSGIPLPGYANQWVNVRKHYRRHYKSGGQDEMPLTLESMIENLGMSFEGRPHSGIDDARNIAKMLVTMVRDGLDPRVNDDIEYQRRLAEQRKAKNK